MTLSGLRKLQNKRAGIKSWISRTETNIRRMIDDIQDDTTKKTGMKDDFTSELMIYKEKVEELKKVQSEILELEEDDIQRETDVDLEMTFYSKCQKALTRFQKVYEVASNQPEEESQGQVNKNEPYKLPRVEIPMFKGELTDWLPFYQSFINAVHKKSMANYLKLTILRQHLEGPALETIKWYSLTDENYVAALDALKRKYGDEQKLIDAYIDELLELRLEQHQSLRHTFDRLQAVVKILESLSVNKDNYSVVLVPMMRSILPKATKTEWARYERAHVQSSATLRRASCRLQNFLDFLQQEVEIKEATDAMKSADLKDEKSKKDEKQDSSRRQNISKRSQQTSMNNDQTKYFMPTANFHTQPHHYPGPVNSPAGFNQAGPMVQQPQGVFYQPPAYPQPQLGQGTISNGTFFTGTGMGRPPPPPCPFCNQNHHPNRCSRAPEFNPQAARDLITQTNRCIFCLGYHPQVECRMQRPCIVCNGNHHPVLCTSRLMTHQLHGHGSGTVPLDQASASTTHQGQDQGQGQVLSKGQTTSPNGPRPFGTYLTSTNQPPVLQTAAVIASNSTVPTSPGTANKPVIRLIMDTGSQRSYVERSLVEHLNLPTLRTEKLATTTFGGNITPLKDTPIVSVRLESRHGFGGIEIQAAVQDTIAASPLSFTLQTGPYPHLAGLPIADSHQLSNLPITILIGMDFYWSIVGSDIRRQSGSKLVAISSLFGYLVSGEDTVSRVVQAHQRAPVFLTVCATSDRSPGLPEIVEKFWDLESLGITEEFSYSNDELAMIAFRDSVHFDGDRYSVGLPWRPDHSPPSNNFESANRRYLKLCQKLDKDERLKEAYSTAMSEFADAGYVERAPIVSQGTVQYYMPHRPVLKSSSSTYKCRPVFDASANDPHGKSLNDCLLIGPSLIPHLLEVIAAFRTEPIGIIGDIRRAFLQIEVQPDDRDVLRFLWNNEIWRFTRVPFGVNSSPFLLNATIRHHLSTRNTANPYEESIESDLSRKMYVDDYVSGDRSVESSVRKIQTSRDILLEAGMDLRSWNSNSAEVLDKLRNQDYHTDSETTTSVLGMTWDTESDFLSVKPVTWTKGDVISKRTVLGFVAQVFDVVGFTSPLTVRGKILLQRLWKEKLTWDQLLTDPEFMLEAQTVICELSQIHELKIPRWVGVISGTGLTLHLLCDASFDAYACVIYATDGNISSLLIAKTRVAPVKPPKTLSTVHCLELLSAYIGAKLLSRILQMPFARQSTTYAWSDSKITLGWLANPTNSRPVFVTNRVRKINELLPNTPWNYIPTSLNTADLATRPNQTVESIKASRWISGPEFLVLPRDEWPDATETEIDVDCEDTFTGLVTREDDVIRSESPESLFELERCSRLKPALRITAYVLRFVRQGRRNSDSVVQLPVGERTLETASGKSVPVPSVEEMNEAVNHWIKFCQSTHYSAEVDALRKSEPISSKSYLWDLGPAMNDDGLMVSVGRTSRAPTRTETPVLLPPKAYFTELLIMNFHESVFHSGVTATITESRQKYWIVRCRQTVKSVLNKCLICRRHKALTYAQKPTALPEWRVTEKAPFRAVGIDFAGPFYVKEKEDPKSYVLLFTCCSTRALHCEVTMDLSEESVINAYRRFVARRGQCDFIASDNAKSFLSAKKRLASELKWITIPERSPWWGGFWERLVRSIKSALRRTIGRNTLTFDDFRTVIPEIENAINRRPITYVSDNRNDPLPLRPVDFLLAPGPPPLEGSASDKDRLTARWRHQQAVYQNLVSRWETEYLDELHKWTTKPSGGSFVPNIGDIVLVDPLNAKNRALFPLGRVEQVIPGNDGHCRVAIVRVRGILLRRSSKLLYPLEVAQNQNQNSDSENGHPNTRDDNGRSEDVPPRETEVVETTNTNVLTRTRSGRLVLRNPLFDDYDCD